MRQPKSLLQLLFIKEECIVPTRDGSTNGSVTAYQKKTLLFRYYIIKVGTSFGMPNSFITF
jgi:hypothetical protein